MASAFVRYAGVKLPVWTPQADDRIARSGLRLSEVFRFADHIDYAPFDGLPTHPQIFAPPARGGVLWWPTGASQFARVHFVASAAVVTSVRAALVSAAGSATNGYVAANLTISDARGGTDFSGNMHFLPPVPLLGGEDESFLLTLVDERYWWWFRPAVDLSAATTWSLIYSTIGTGLGEAITVDGSLASFAAPSSRWLTLGTLPLPVLLDAAAWSTGRRIVRTPGGTVRATDYATAKAAEGAVQSGIPAVYRLRGGGPAPDSDLRKNAPASVVVRGAGTEQVVTLAALAPADYAGVTGKAGYRYTMNVDAATLTAGEAGAVATEWYNWLLAGEDASYAGVSGFNPCGWWGAVEWVYRKDEVATRTLPYPWPIGHSAGQPDAVPPCDGYPVIWPVQVGIAQTTAVVSGTTVVTGVQAIMQNAYIDVDGCWTWGPEYCADPRVCTPGENYEFWCIEGVCTKVYGGYVPPSGTGPYATAELCAAGCVDAWYCDATYACTFVAAGDTPPVGYVGGPYTTEAECLAVCVSPGEGCCPGVGVPDTTYIAFAVGGTATLVYNLGTGYWEGSHSIGGCTVYFRVSEAGGCIGIEYSRDQATWFAATCLNGEEGCVIECDPFGVTGVYSFNWTGLGGGCAGSTTGTYSE